MKDSNPLRTFLLESKATVTLPPKSETYEHDNETGKDIWNGELFADTRPLSVQTQRRTTKT